METEHFHYRGVTLPLSVVAVNVTNILTPYIIRISKIQDCEEKFKVLHKKLLLLERKLCNTDARYIEPKIGDTIIACDNLHKDIDLPAWLCRGIISNAVNNSENTYNVFLVDYGTSVVLERENFVVCSTDTISEEYLSSTVGLYNVLPAAINNDTSTQDASSSKISEEWSLSAIEYTKELMTASDTVYFDYLASDEHGKQYGEFYFIIEDTVISLSMALVLNNYAIYLEEELQTFIENPENYEKSYKRVINGETMFYINISNDHKINNEPCKQKRRYLKESLEMEKILIYGQMRRESLNTVSDLRFPAEIHKAWNTLIKSTIPTKLQSYIWPAIKKGLDVIAIGAEKSGKTFGYVFAVCGLLATNSNLPKNMNPSALILCSSSAEVLEVQALCTIFLQSYKAIPAVSVINGKTGKSLMVEAYNGCRILISTPNSLLRFMGEIRKLLNFESLRYLIIDDGDIVLDKYFDSVIKLFKRHKVIYNRELQNNNISLQIIITGRHWTPRLNKIARTLMYSPYICIASFIEAAIYKSVLPKMYIIHSKNKHKQILELLGYEYSKLRTVIVCVNSNEAEELYEFLRRCKDCILAHEDIDMIRLQDVKHCWDVSVSGSYPILICTDEVLSDLHVTNALWLIHYSISLRFKTQFNYRFSTLFESLQTEKLNCQVTIMVDENSDVQFLSIIKIMQRMNVVIPPDMSKNIERITAGLDKNKEKFPICTNVKLWGFCCKKYSCALRHGIISEIDTPAINIRMNDKIKLRVLNIHDVTHISARIVSYIKFDTLEEIELSNVDYMEITMKIQEFYSSFENRRRCETVNVGGVYGLEEPIDSFKRVEILNVETDDKTDTPKFVDVRCIDNGVILTKLNAYRLLHLPEELIKYPTQAVEVFLAGVVPHDDEYLWNRYAFDAVYQWFKQNVDERSYVIATVNLHLRNILWVNTLEVGTKLIGYKDIVGSSLKTELLEKDHAIENDKHLRQLYQLCKEAGFLDINGCNLNVLLNEVE
ncbi:putative ATP-dependent RNA helicase TDRD12 isoform X2 [Colletes latitarsis]|uniref:putative ATP-dependent RNA helicase TDRD12 isoform X2 n=1 Tax=Colletes latitarsis TaxID=2605962 RepID=UPI0040363BB4